MTFLHITLYTPTDLARSCSLLHPTGSENSSTVMQRNPFSLDHEMGWMNILELPFTSSGGRNNYHGHYIIAKNTGVLGRVRRETRCEVKMCGNEYKVPTQFCAPYVWVMGHTPGEVDKAVEILRSAIQNHMRHCKCRF